MDKSLTAVGRIPSGLPHEEAGQEHSPSAGEAPELQPPNQTQQQQQTPKVGRALTTTANLAKLLPTGTVLAFQSLIPSFTNRGICCAANRYLTLALITSCALSCFFFSFTDSVIGPGGKLYVGVATFKGFYVISSGGGHQDDEAEERELGEANLRELRIQWVDYVHAFFSVMVFLVLVLSDSEVQRCLFENPGQDTRQYLVNLPLGAGFLASVVFMVLPSSRRGIGYSDMTPRTLPVSIKVPKPAAVDRNNCSLVN